MHKASLNIIYRVSVTFCRFRMTSNMTLEYDLQNELKNGPHSHLIKVYKSMHNDS